MNNRRHIPRCSKTALLLFFLLPVLQGKLDAQYSNTLFFMHDVVQSRYLNPAVGQQCRVTVGIPALSSVYFNYANNAVSYNDLFGRRAPHVLDPRETLDRLHRRNYIETSLQPTLISLGYRMEDFTLSFDIIEKVDLLLGIPRDLIALPLLGNARADEVSGVFEDENAFSLNGLGVDLMHFREYSLGLSQVASEYLSRGIRLKMLFGKFNLNTRKINASFITDPVDYDLTLRTGNLINASLPLDYTIENGNITGVAFTNPSLSNLLLNRRNYGVAIDLGSIWSYHDPLVLHGSVLDLGFIRWRTNPINVSQDGEFTYSGIDDLQDVNFSNYFNEILDTLAQEFLIESGSESYFTLAPVKVYLGATYRLSEKFNAGLLSRNELKERRVFPSLTLSANYKPFRHLFASLSYTVANRSYDNVGLGLGFGSEIMQFYVINDNVLGTIFPQTIQNLGVRFGLNLLLGCRERVKPCGPGCFWLRKYQNDKRRPCR